MPSSDHRASSSPRSTDSSTAWMPGPPVLVMIPILRPAGISCMDMATAALIISSVSVNWMTPAFPNIARAIMAWSTRVPVCDDTATEPSRVRPALMARMGFSGVIREATSRKAAGSLKLSICIMITRVPGSLP